MLNKTLKRFYKLAAAAAVDGGYAVQLDGKGVKTPAAKPLVVPGLALATAMAAEWTAQETEIRPSTMPLTQLASTALDRVGPERQAILAQLRDYGATDLLCYRAACPLDLVERQARQWQPWLDWARKSLGADLAVTEGIMAVEQSDAALTALSQRLDSYDLWRLTAVQSACASAGSLVLALALGEGQLTGQQIFDLSQLDETYQIEKWGEDYEAADRRARLHRDLLAADQFLILLSADG